MKILILGGTRFFGIPMTKKLAAKNDVTIATRGKTADNFGDSVSRLIIERSDENSVKAALKNRKYDVVIDITAYSSNDVKRVLDNVKCEKYILMSSSAVYENIHNETTEDEFKAVEHPLKWCERSDFGYGEAKRQAESCVAQYYPEQAYISVRYPVVIGEHDYTKRLYFYVEHVINSIPMFIDDMDSRISFIHEDDAGEFLAYLVESDVRGAVNGCCRGDIFIKEIVSYIERNTGKKAVLSAGGDAAPYNGYPSFATLNTSKAEKTGFIFTEVHNRIYETIDNYIKSLS